MKMTKQFLLTLSILISGILIASCAGGYLIQHTTLSFSLQKLLQNYQWQFAIWRYTAFALLIWFWPELITRLGKYKQWPEELVDAVVKQRLPVTLFFILFELLIVHNVFGYIISHIF